MITKTIKALSLFALILGSTHAVSQEQAPEETKDNKNKERRTFTVSNRYVHEWIELPKLEGRKVSNGNKVVIKPKRGVVTVVMFLASWCEKCQQLIPVIKKIEEEYKPRYTRFIYVFTHDTKSDANGFRKTYKLGGTSILASHQILADFKQPPLPSFIISDRNKWLTLYIKDLNLNDVKKTEEFLKIHTAN
tara:strand:+ start:1710 stop:2282 length:573 start_codon:yes stop_codon:yes gene_type:complete